MRTHWKVEGRKVEKSFKTNLLDLFSLHSEHFLLLSFLCQILVIFYERYIAIEKTLQRMYGSSLPTTLSDPEMEIGFSVFS